jgi:hypothetical protein
MIDINRQNMLAPRRSIATVALSRMVREKRWVILELLRNNGVRDKRGDRPESPHPDTGTFLKPLPN